ncbi:hypothetical protein C1646_321474 [Rhizophagus diaphanus]|nr:hypothetical protein C1646_822954 [Rhizophagus diaphanus] [Rhizophagus sp. MUCL 43196]RGB41287.1 hypothetical protein C1646_321474 [Rhizophagus diaphanus] [Rhizophagus sp. MUCL 43196]
MNNLIMNRNILLLILVTLFLASTITADVYRKLHKRHKLTKIIPTPSPSYYQINNEKKHQKRYGHKRYENVVPCTPTTAMCFTLTPTPLVCTPSGGSCEMANPEACCSKGCALQTDGTFACCKRTGDVFNCNIK